MVEVVSVRLDEKTVKEVKDLEKEMRADRSEVIRRLLDQAIKEQKLKRALALLREQKISIGKAAELASLTIYEMIALAETHDIKLGYAQKDLERDLKKFGL